MRTRLYICMGVETLVVFSKCIESSMHKFLYICMGVETLVVLFKCLKSSIHRFLYICMGVETLVVLFKCPESSLRLLSIQAVKVVMWTFGLLFRASA
jgi:hypothetical protein